MEDYLVEWDGEGVYAKVYLCHILGTTTFVWKRAGTREEVNQYRTIADGRPTRYAYRRSDLPGEDRVKEQRWRP